MSTAPISVGRGETQLTRWVFLQRGLVVGIIAVGLGACLIRVGNRVTVPSTDLAILATMGVASIFGANEARRLATAQASVADAFFEASEVHGPWMTVTVNPAGPSDTSGSTMAPESPPRDDPERRSLLRRARDRVPAGTSRR